jgi:hypothetical protein
MPALVRVLGGVMIWRGVATEGDAACLTSPQMNPVVANLHAFFAFAALRLFDRCDRGEMRTASLRHCPIVAALNDWNQPPLICKRASFDETAARLVVVRTACRALIPSRLLFAYLFAITFRRIARHHVSFAQFTEWPLFCSRRPM